MTEPVERTSDGRYIVVGGRRWRATDPNVPESLRQELVGELMDARRSVRTARSDPDALAAVRARVQNAKVALGERGQPWWEDPTSQGRSARARAALLTLAHRRGPEGVVSVAEAATVVASPQWRSALEVVGDVAQELERSGLLLLARGEAGTEPPQPVDTVRYSLPPAS